MSTIGVTEILFYLLYLTTGLVVGAIYFALLRWSLVPQDVRTSRLVSSYLLRFAIAAAAFWLVAQQGAIALLLALAGFMLARTAAQYWMRLE